jgi:hypothetical protein
MNKAVSSGLTVNLAHKHEDFCFSEEETDAVYLKEIELVILFGFPIPNKQKIILDYLDDKGGTAHYIDIRDTIGLNIDNEEDFDRTLKKLIACHLVAENEHETLYKVLG